MANPEEILIIEGLKAGGTVRRRYENILWEKYKDLITWGVTRSHLSHDEVRLAYDDAICSSIINIVTGRYEQESTSLLKTYVEAIFHRKCIDHMDRSTNKEPEKKVVRKNIKNPQPISESLMEKLPFEVKNAIEKIIEQEDRMKMRQCLERLGEICKEILMLFGGNYKDKEIAELMHYHSQAVAKQTRYRCLEKLSEVYFNMQWHERNV
jgi:RNA polymerase sigma-70 factor (ECF subfamily)